MNADILLKHFDRISEAPDAVARLRRFILDLAVRGKLVEHSANWEETTLGEVGEWGSGGTPSKSHLEYYDGDIPWLVIGDLNEGLVTRAETHITEAGLKNSSAKIVEPGTVLIAMYGSIGKLGIAGIRCATNQAMAFCVPDQEKVSREFLVIVLKSLREELLDRGHGVAQQNISQKILKSHPAKLPPLGEQHRIVAKVDELMALCDQLEAAKNEREARRDRLVAASLHRIGIAPAAEGEAQDAAQTAAALRQTARFHLDHLPRLTTRPEHIKQLRQTILDLAVCGGLSENAEWALNPLPLKSGATLQNGYAFKSEWFSKTGVRLLRNTNVSHGVLCWDDLACLPLERVEEYERFQLSKGDVVLSLDRPFIVTGTKVARVSADDLPCLLLQRVGRFQLNPTLLSSDYLFLWIQSPHFTSQVDPGRSNGVPHISSKQVESALIFFPPLAEQHRIVAKVDELMALCDQLETQLATSEADSRRLLEAVLRDALAPALEQAA